MKAAIHWNKQRKIWSVHTYRGCSFYPQLLIDGPWHVELKPQNKTNPRGWVVTDHTNLKPINREDVEGFERNKRLIYDKDRVTFNVLEGRQLLFDEKGCFVIA